MRTILGSTWLTFLFPLFLFVFLALGIIYSRRFYHRHKRVWKPVGIENGLLGIFAILISFTMVVSGNFDRERADYIHGEAEELSLIFRTSKLYDDTLRRRVHQYLKDFLRVQLSKKTPSTRECAQLIDSIEAIDRTLDLFLLDYRQRNATAEADIKNLIPLLTKASSKYYLLLYSFMERTPVPMMVTLILLSFTMAFLVGFMNSFQETPNNVIPVIFFITTVLMITGIRDLDNPSRGLITPRYEELEDIQKLIKNSR